MPINTASVYKRIACKTPCIVFLSSVLFALLAGCTTKPDINDSVPTLTVPEREAQLRAFKPWRALGSIAIDSAEQGKFNASFAWNVDNQGFDIKIFGPLGIQAFQLTENKSGAQLIDRKGTLEGDNAEQLINSVLGSDVPVGRMQLWMVGLPGDATQIKRDDAGRLDSMSVAAGDDTVWKVDFTRYTLLEKLYLPKTVLIDGNGVSIRLSISKWSRLKPVSNGRLSIPGVSS